MHVQTINTINPIKQRPNAMLTNLIRSELVLLHLHPRITNKNVNKNIFFLILKYFILNLIIFVVVATLVLSEV